MTFQNISRNRASWLLPAVMSLVLFALVLVLYWPLRHGKFINCDDPDYVMLNGHVWNGLTWPNIRWAFALGPGHASNWHPLTWLSHMLDCQMFGVESGPHHLVNVVLHGFNAVLVLCFLQRLTKTFWPSVLMAALFAVHPLRVESVAWIAERKDVLCAFFSLLTLLSYQNYVQTKQRPRTHYVITLGLFILALLSKPMAVTLPFVLLLLDFWPARRLGRRAWLEKIPFFVCSAGASYLTMIAQERAMASLAGISLGNRLGNAMLACAGYLRKIFWPSDLAIFYQHPVRLPFWPVIAGTSVVVLLTIVAIWNIRRRPWLLFGWLWFLGMLFPTIGLVQVGGQAMADRYTYLPSIGLVLAVVLTVEEFLRSRLARRLAFGLGVGMLMSLAVMTRWLVPFWLDPVQLFRHGIEVTSENYFLDHNLANALANSGRHLEALPYYEKALSFLPNDGPVFHHLGNNYVRLERYDQALAAYEQSILNHPDDPETYFDYGSVLSMLHRYDQAGTNFEKAIALEPAYADAHINYANTLLAQHKMTEAIGHYQKALAIFPDMPEAHFFLSSAYALSGRWAEAVAQLRVALHYRPDYASAANDLAWILATSPDPGLYQPKEAVPLAEKACGETGQKTPGYLDTLAVAYAAVGRFSDAIRVTERVIQVAGENEQQRALIPLMKTRLELYQQKLSYRPSTPDPVSVPNVSLELQNH